MILSDEEKHYRILSDEEKHDSLWRRETWFSLTKRNRILSDEEKQDSLFLSDEGPVLETLDYTIRIGSTPTLISIS